MKYLKVIFPIVIVLVFGLWYFMYPKLQVTASEIKVTKVTPEDARLYYKFVNSGEDWLARSGEFEIKKEQFFEQKKYKYLLAKESEILMTLIYRQQVVLAKTAPSRLEFSFPYTEASFQALLNRYGLPILSDTTVSFNSDLPQNVLSKVDEILIKKSDIDKSNYLWGAYQTEIFQWTLSWIGKTLKQQVLIAEANKVGLNVQDYKSQYIDHLIDSGLNPKSIEEFRKTMNYAKTEDGLKFTKKKLREQLSQKSFDYFMETYLLDLPILVNLSPPTFKIEIDQEYVPSMGPANSELKITIFRDSTSRPSQHLVAELYKLANSYQGLFIAVRPIISSGNIFQELREKINHCVWALYPDIYWEYLIDSQGFFNANTQEKLFAVITQRKQPLPPVEKCIKDEQSQKVMDYHKQYSQYLGIQSGPVVFVGEEAMVAPVSIQRIEAVINRQLGFPDAAIWKMKND